MYPRVCPPIRRLEQIRAAIWAKGTHILDSFVRIWAEYVLPGSEWFVVFWGTALVVFLTTTFPKSRFTRPLEVD